MVKSCLIIHVAWQRCWRAVVAMYSAKLGVSCCILAHFAGWLAAGSTTLDLVVGLSIRVYLVAKITSRPSQTGNSRLICLKIIPNTASQAQDVVSYTIGLE